MYEQALQAHAAQQAIQQQHANNAHAHHHHHHQHHQQHQHGGGGGGPQHGGGGGGGGHPHFIYDPPPLEFEDTPTLSPPEGYKDRFFPQDPAAAVAHDPGMNEKMRIK
jgi:hypothetical protein